jgi:hypothetical protein
MREAYSKRSQSLKKAKEERTSFCEQKEAKKLY